MPSRMNGGMVRTGRCSGAKNWSLTPSASGSAVSSPSQEPHEEGDDLPRAVDVPGLEQLGQAAVDGQAGFLVELADDRLGRALAGVAAASQEAPMAGPGHTVEVVAQVQEEFAAPVGDDRDRSARLGGGRLGGESLGVHALTVVSRRCVMLPS